MKINLKTAFLSILLIIILSSFVNANGLRVIETEVFNINKTVGTNKDITFSITNEEPFSFYNISFEDNDYISMNTISELTSGSTIEVTGTINSDDDFNGLVEIYGFYQSNIGKQYVTHNITVDYGNGLSVCDLSIIIGDSITWSNSVSDEIKLKNENTGNDVTIISQNNNYTTLFDTPEIFTYSFYRRGLRFTDVCEITALSDSGMINDPNMNTNISLNLKVEHDPTILEIQTIENNYTLDFLETTEGVLLIKNTGDKKAVDINLYGGWFSFNKNNFDLEEGESTPVIYTIVSNKEGIYSTNDTGKNYNKNITVNGNFNNMLINFDIYINHAEIGDNYTYNSSNSLIDTICALRPDLCDPEPRIIYRYMNSSDDSFNITFQKDQVDEMFKAIFENMDSTEIAMNYFKSQIQNITSKDDITSQDIATLKGLLEQDRIDRENVKDDYTGTFLIVVFTIISLLLGATIFFYNRYKKFKDLEKA